MAVSFNKSRSGPREPRQPKPLDAEALNRLALHYVGKYATTRGKLSDYLRRKLRERGWAGDGAGPDIIALAERFSALGYIDDRAFAEMRAESLGRRGYGVRRVSQALTVAGITEEDAAPVRAAAQERGWESALAYARRKRIGPWGEIAIDPARREKQLAAMIRAGHPFDHARRIISALPGETLDVPE
ncbi:regulatory protein RecX [Sphingobium boeckii]|uniref:Regulatory protein RecX n=1 Tax=Sphingobium boeckii TaxID=1082345 RepID=A0A7W9AHL2_9SPHN|nr:regulatory protein RecX [Sphingobium boeckii]MBB5685614.1 regulatory protein [Sphingobium boeckii]